MNKKKILSYLLVATISWSLIPTAALAATTSGTVTVSTYGSVETPNVTVNYVLSANSGNIRSGFTVISSYALAHNDGSANHHSYMYLCTANMGDTLTFSKDSTDSCKVSVQNTEIASSTDISISFKMPDTGVSVIMDSNNDYVYTVLPNNSTTQLLTQQLSSVYNSLASNIASNSTSISDLTSVANSVIDTSTYNVSLSQSSRTDATESSSGLITGTIHMSLVSDSSKYVDVPFTVVIPRLAQSLTTIYNTLNNYCTSYGATNSSADTDFTNAVTITNSEYSVSVGEWSKTNSTDTSLGSLYCNVYIKYNGTIVKTISILKSISKLATTTTTAKTTIDSIVSNYVALNNSSKNDLLTALKNAVGNNITVTIPTWDLITATETTKGSLVARIGVTDGNTSSTVEVSKVIGVTEQSASTLYSMLNNFCGNYNATNNSISSDLTDAIVITNPTLSVEISDWILTPATSTKAGRLTSNLYVKQNGVIQYTIPVSKTISKLDDSALVAKDTVNSAISSYDASNNTTSDNLLNLAKSVVNTNYITCTIENFKLVKATETSRGSVSATIYVTDTLGVKAEVPVYLTLDYLKQSVETVASLYSKASKTYIPTNDTIAQDIIDMISITNSDISAKAEDFKLIPSTDESTGKVSVNLSITNSHDGTSVIQPIQITIANQPQELATALSEIQKYLASVEVNNSTKINSLLIQINNVITNSDIFCSYSIDSGEEITLTPATMSQTGLIKGYLLLADSNSHEVKIPVNLVIAQLPQTVSDAKEKVHDILDYTIATNSMTESDLLFSLQSALTDVGGSNIEITLSSFYKQEATELLNGRIKGVVSITDGSTTETIDVNLNIDLQEQTLATLKDLVEQKIKDTTLTNSTTYSSLENMLKSCITGAEGSTLGLTVDLDNFKITESSEITKGLISGKVTIFDDNGNIGYVPFSKVISEQLQSLDSGINNIDNIIDSLDGFNSLTKEQLLILLNDCKTPNSDITIDISDFDNRNSTSTKAGKITCTITVSDGELSKTIYFDKTIVSESQTVDNISTGINGILNNSDFTTVSDMSEIDTLLSGILDGSGEITIDTSNLILTPSGEDVVGSLIGIITVSDSEGNSKIITINIVIPTKNQTVDNISTGIEAILNSADFTTVTDVSEIDYLLSGLLDGSGEITIDTSNLVITAATNIATGSIVGTIIVTDKDGNTKTIDVNITLPIKTLISESAGGGGGGASIDTVTSVEIAAPTSAVTIQYSEGIEVTNTDLTTLLGLSGDIKVIQYNWKAYKDDLIVNEGTLQAFFKDGVSQGVLVDSSSPLDSNTNVDISFIGSLDLTSLYNYSDALGKYVLADSTLINADGKITFNGNNNSTYLVTSSNFDTSTNESFATDGWVQGTDSNSWYLVEDSKIVTGWNEEEDTWYYLSEQEDVYGVMQTGWKQIDNIWYYLNADGTMSTGWIMVNESWYYLNSSGMMQTGWLNNNGNWYYLDSNGVMKTGWIQDGDSNWYYFYSNGIMAVDTYIDGYYVNSAGTLV